MVLLLWQLFAGTLSLMDAGIQMIRPVSGIAMGLITDGDRLLYCLIFLVMKIT
jgi:polyribonucleotide nucleotidyltransferase